MTRPNDLLERLSRYLTLLAFALAVVSAFLAPTLALSWRNQPFPGFLMDHTLVVTDLGNESWSGRAAGLSFGQKLVRLGGIAIYDSGDYEGAIAMTRVGDRITIFTQLQDGTAKLYPNVEVTAFPASDFLQLFWMPYVLGMGYLAVGFWIYRARGTTLPGRGLAFFSFCAAILCSMYFDVFSSHFLTPVWSLATALLGGALISLAMRFPVESTRVARHRIWLFGPYLISLLLAVWATSTLYNTEQPWAYIAGRNWSYRYAGVGALIFLAVVFYHSFRGRQSIVRRQARIVLLGTSLSFAPLMVWIFAPMLGVEVPFNPLLFMSPLIVFPFSVAIAIFRYRLLEMDAIVNRTIVWGVLTAVLAGVISVSVTILQRFFVATTGEKSDVAVVLTSLILVSVFTPVKTRLQAVVDRTFKETQDNTRELKSFGEQVNSFVQFGDSHQITRRLLNEAVAGLGAQSGAISLQLEGHLETVHTAGDWRGSVWVSAPLEHAGHRYGLLQLGPRNGAGPYSREDFVHLQRVAGAVAHALHVTNAWKD
jgi:hypothetical protein